MAKINAINNKSSELTVDPGASGDSFIQFDINGTGEFRIGVDDDAGDSFKISQGSALGSNDAFIMSSAGERTMPLQPAFLAYLASDDSNVTGDSTLYRLGASTAFTEVFDQNNDFNTNGTFTAPVTGKYLFTVTIKREDLDSGHTVETDYILTSNRTYWYGWVNPFAESTGGEWSTEFSHICDMDASDVTTFYINIAGGTKVVDLSGGADVFTSVAGALLC